MRYRYIGPNAPLLGVRVPLSTGAIVDLAPDAAGEFDAPDDWRALTALDGAKDMATGAPLYARQGPPAPPAAPPAGGRQFRYVGPAAPGEILLRLRHEDGTRHEYRIAAGQPFAVADPAALRALRGDVKYREMTP